MSGERALPEQASLRYLKLEAKRRVAAGEFPALHAAQLAIAREHGQLSWAALRSAVAALLLVPRPLAGPLGRSRPVTSSTRARGDRL